MLAMAFVLMASGCSTARLDRTETGERYQPELADFSDITLSADGSMFTVVTKSGETRYYGMDDTARVRVPGIDNPPPDGMTTAIWLLQKVVDVWGNYYDIHYNYDKKDFATGGIIVSQIDYTGRLAGSAADDEAAAIPTFQSIKFSYEPRPDVRQGRFRSATVRETRGSRRSTPASVSTRSTMARRQPIRRWTTKCFLAFCGRSSTAPPPATALSR